MFSTPVHNFSAYIDIFKVQNCYHKKDAPGWTTHFEKLTPTCTFDRSHKITYLLLFFPTTIQNKTPVKAV